MVRHPLSRRVTIVGATLALLFLGSSLLPAASAQSTNRPPEASFDSRPWGDGWTYDFDGSWSWDPDGDPLTYEWTFWTGATLSGTDFAQKKFQCSGLYKVKLKVTDIKGASDTTEDLIMAGDDTSYPTSAELADADKDRLTRCAEDVQQTTDTKADFDADGLSDYIESTWLLPYERGNMYCDGDGFSWGLPCAYPNPRIKNLYIEVDWFAGYDWTAGASKKITDAFTANRPDIAVTIDRGGYGGGGEVLEGNGVISKEQAKQDLSPNHLNPYRKGIFHHIIIGCSQPRGGSYGQADVAGYFVMIWKCTIDQSAPTETALAATVLHEMGHNILGAAHKSHSATETATCQEFHRVRNANLNHFSRVDGTFNNCDGDQTPESFTHSTDESDVMGKPPLHLATVNYAAATWAALRLNLIGVEPLNLGGMCAPIVQNEILHELLPLECLDDWGPDSPLGGAASFEQGSRAAPGLAGLAAGFAFLAIALVGRRRGQGR